MRDVKSFEKPRETSRLYLHSPGTQTRSTGCSWWCEVCGQCGIQKAPRIAELVLCMVTVLMRVVNHCYPLSLQNRQCLSDLQDVTVYTIHSTFFLDCRRGLVVFFLAVGDAGGTASFRMSTADTPCTRLSTHTQSMAPK